MKDNDVVKALECCQTSDTDCVNCPFNFGCLGTNYESLLAKNALELIKRQKGENERLKTAYETLKQEYDSMFSANRNLMAEVERLQKFKHYFDDLYALGLEIANWHHNGKLEPFDNFYDSAIKEMTERKDEKQ